MVEEIFKNYDDVNQEKKLSNNNEIQESQALNQIDKKYETEIQKLRKQSPKVAKQVSELSKEINNLQEQIYYIDKEINEKFDSQQISKKK